ncbi:hypothetical protein [Paenibacillus herberti]|uniref:Phage tail tape measure protein n=1 Tax=Paenibacillus herberti TaxID=1619309 RepID=A0A229NYW8_9BACL|nr:hypothetical protein [Paenibacillus herberti]OXM15226.1 hypothetical protein CGZ75_00300 [Paenibacillus herberti]
MIGKEVLAIATLQATITLYDRFTSGLGKANKTLERTIQLSEKLRSKLSIPLKTTVEADKAKKALDGLKKQVDSLRKQPIQIKLDESDFSQQVSRLRSELEKKLTAQPFLYKLQGQSSAAAPAASPTPAAATASPSQAAASTAAVTAFPWDSMSQGAVAGIQAVGKAMQTADKISKNGMPEFMNLLAGRSVTAADGIAGLSAMLQQLIQVFPLFPAVVKSAMEQQSIKDQYKVKTGSDAGGEVLYNAVGRQALKANVDQLEAQKSGIALTSVTTDPAMLTALNGFTMRMQKLNPSNKQGAVGIDLRKLLSGDTSVLKGYEISDKDFNASGAQKAIRAGDGAGFVKAFDRLLSAKGMSQSQFNQLQQTPGAKMQGLQQHLNVQLGLTGVPAMEALIPMVDQLTAAFEAGKFDSFFGALSAGLWVVGELLAKAGEAVVAFGDFFSMYGDQIVAMLIAVGLVLLPLLVIQIWSMVAPLAAVAFQWMIINAPILIIMVAVMALVGILLHFGVTSEQIVGTIVGSFFFLGSAIYNIVAFVWNLFASLSNFLFNLFVDPIYAIKMLFYELAKNFLDLMYNMILGAETFAGGFMKTILKGINGVISGVNWLIKALNKIPDVDIKQAKLLDENNQNAISSGIKNMADSLVKPTSDKNVVVSPQMKYKDSAAAYNNGYDKGAQFIDKMKNHEGLFGKDKEEEFKGKTKITAGPPPTTPGTNDIGRVGEVGSIKDEVDIGSEDLKVMRDLAEMKAIQNFVTLTPTVQVTTGPVNSKVDVNDVVREITTSMEREIQWSAQGVFGF